ncbi:hypothetical protein KBA73_02745 [Patescibacteria group bacterium]|nr:hypothetical protein [Patescibacteria group bacterium]
MERFSKRKETPLRRESPSSGAPSENPLTERGRQLDKLGELFEARKVTERDAIREISAITDVESLAARVDALLVEISARQEHGLTKAAAEVDLETLAIVRNRLVVCYARLDELWSSIDKGIRTRKRIEITKKSHEEAVRAEKEARSFLGMMKSLVSSLAPTPMAVSPKKGREVELLVMEDENDQELKTLTHQKEKIAALQRNLEDAMSQIRTYLRGK